MVLLSSVCYKMDKHLRVMLSDTILTFWPWLSRVKKGGMVLACHMVLATIVLACQRASSTSDTQELTEK